MVASNLAAGPEAAGSAPSSLSQAFDRMPLAMVAVARGGLIVHVNAHAEQTFGYARDELVGQPVETLVPERYRRGHPGYREGFFHSPNARPMGAGRDLYARRKDGSEFPVEIGLNPIVSEEGPMVLSVIVDISERKEREARIEAALKEKDLLLGEIHHRVKNNLQIIHSLLDLQAMKIEDATVRDMLRDSQNRVRSMSLIHQTLYQSKDFAEVDFQHFLNSLLPILMQSYAVDTERVILDMDAADVRLPISAAIPCGLVVNELVANALRHAFPGGARGRVWVDLTEEAGETVVLSVCNDGVPIPETLDFGKAQTLGMQLVGLLAEQLGGTLDIQRASPTRFSLRFPVTHG